MYDPPSRPARAFETDYPSAKWPNGFPADASGRLARDIEGRELNPYARIIGRRELGGADVPLGASELAEVAKGLTGRNLESAPARALRGDAGQYLKFAPSRLTSLDYPGRGYTTAILTREGLSDADLPRVLAHEIGHAVDDLAGTGTRYVRSPDGRAIPFGAIPQQRVSRELSAVYNDLNNPALAELRAGRYPDALVAELPAWYQGRKHRGFGPADKNYSAAEAPAEYMAEAIRAYMADPNYLKTVAPKTAAAIRKAVNENPRLSSTVQFNSGGSAVPLAGAAVVSGSPPDQPAPFSLAPRK